METGSNKKNQVKAMMYELACLHLISCCCKSNEYFFFLKEGKKIRLSNAELASQNGISREKLFIFNVETFHRA